jgi:hypothetical protein
LHRKRRADASRRVTEAGNTVAIVGDEDDDDMAGERV